MTDNLSAKIYRQLFTEDQWDLIYSVIGNALDDDIYDHADVHAIRRKISKIFELTAN